MTQRQAVAKRKALADRAASRAEKTRILTVLVELTGWLVPRLRHDGALVLRDADSDERHDDRTSVGAGAEEDHAARAVACQARDVTEVADPDPNVGGLG